MRSPLFAACGRLFDTKKYGTTNLLVRAHLIGAAMLFCVFVQFLSGLFLLGFANDSSFRSIEVVKFIHWLTPVILVLLAVGHALRAVAGNRGSQAARVSGVTAAAVLFIVAGTGYTVSGGEAGFWGSIVGMSVLPDLIAVFYENAHLIVLGLFDQENTVNILTGVTGSFALGSSLGCFLLTAHIALAASFFLAVMFHVEQAHAGASSKLSGVVQPTSNTTSLGGYAEVRDLVRILFLVIATTPFFGTAVVSFRIGNNVRFWGETFIPDTVNTEIYWSGVYVLVRSFTLAASLFVVLTVALLILAAVSYGFNACGSSAVVWLGACFFMVSCIGVCGVGGADTHFASPVVDDFGREISLSAIG